MTGPGRGTALLVLALAGSLALALVVQLAVFYLRLGWFGPLPWIVGGVAIIAVGWWRARAPGRALVLLTLVLLVYGAGLAATEALWFGQRSRVDAKMTWQDLGAENESGQREVVLHFVDHPAYLVGEYSDALARHLQQADRAIVDATFVVTRDLGCLRGFRLQEVAGLTQWPSAWGYAGSRGIGGEEPPSPWAVDPWWCP
jgi:hypothetical protein